MSTSDCFTNATGHVYLHGKEEPVLRAVGFVHRHPCPQQAVATVEIGGRYGCDCGGTVLIGWRDWWPLPNDPPGPTLLIDLSDPHGSGSAGDRQDGGGDG